MSTTNITIERVNEVKHHPDADSLDTIQVLGYQVITGRDQYQVGDSVIYFPPDILIPQAVAEKIGVETYLKHAVFPGTTGKSKCRVGSIRLRGEVSHGLVLAAAKTIGSEADKIAYGTDVTELYEGVKYEPPVRQGCGDSVDEHDLFHRYTSIEHWQKFPDSIPEGTEVVITEKLHGTNVRMGRIAGEYVAGSHKVQRKMPEPNETPSLYWAHYNENVIHLVDSLCGEYDSVIVFGEIFGQGVQDMDYGTTTKQFRMFDICCDGEYLDFNDMMKLAINYCVPTVPVLYHGDFDPEVLLELTDGPTVMSTGSLVQSKFKGREGVVVKPVVEQKAGQHRMIFKSVSADYRARKGALDLA